MREPVSRFHSRYRFNREILPAMKSKKMLRAARGRSKNINSCVASRHPECDYRHGIACCAIFTVLVASGTLERWHKQFRLDSQLPFLCGDSEACRTLGHQGAANLTIGSTSIISARQPAVQSDQRY